MAERQSIQILPPSSSLSSQVISFLNDKLDTEHDIPLIRILVAELELKCSDLHKILIALGSRLHSSIGEYDSFSVRTRNLFSDINSKLGDLGSLSSTLYFLPDEDKGNNVFLDNVLGEELLALAKDVHRMEKAVEYTETAMKLDSLVGDVEDAVFSALNRNPRKTSKEKLEEMQLLAIRSLLHMEDTLIWVTQNHQWNSLISTVDYRVERALAIFRPQAIANHRNLLTFLKWPPHLFFSASSNNEEKSLKACNPLLTVQDNLRHRYLENFLSLCCLQELQNRRTSRQQEGCNRELVLQQPLWAIEELASPLSIACRGHFSKWVDKQEFMFALVYKIIEDFTDTLDELLQPLIDEAKLVGYSCREEWISAMVLNLSMYLAQEVFPIYMDQLDDENDAIGAKLHSRILFLHLMDLMITFDKRVQSFLTASGSLVLIVKNGNMLKISCLSVFCGRADWLDLWADAEFNDVLEKLKPVIGVDQNWHTETKAHEAHVFPPSSENFKCPLVSSVVLEHLSMVINRCRSLPTNSLRARFLRLAGVPFLNVFIECLAFRCLEAEQLTALTDDNAIVKVATCLNAARYLESVLKEWGGDMLFLGMEAEDDHIGHANVSTYDNSASIFYSELKIMYKLREEWVEKISVAVLRGFDAGCRDYVKNNRQWEDNSEEWSVAGSLMVALDYLQGKMQIIRDSLNEMDFVDVWRSMAAGLDSLLFTSILVSSNVKFCKRGIEKFGHDLEAIFGVFGVPGASWCLRPEGFFPKLWESLKLLKVGEEIQLQDCLADLRDRAKLIDVKQLSDS